MKLTVKKSEINKELIVLNGVYFVYYVYDDKECIYIGSSKNIYKRFKAHKTNISFSHIVCMSFTSEIECKTFERIEIYNLKPVLNTFDKKLFRIPEIKKHSFSISELINSHKTLNR